VIPISSPVLSVSEYFYFVSMAESRVNSSEHTAFAYFSRLLFAPTFCGNNHLNNHCNTPESASFLARSKPALLLRVVTILSLIPNGYQY
jgi:hypothetical protein